MANEDDKKKEQQTKAASDPSIAAGLGGIQNTGGALRNEYRTGVPEGWTTRTGNMPYTVMVNGKPTQRYYDLTNDPAAILQTMDPTVRDQILTGLESKIRGYKRGNGFDDRDRSAFSDLLLYSNLAGLPYQNAFQQFMRNVESVQQTGTKAPTIRVTSIDDIKVVYRKTASELLGRNVSDEDATAFAKMYQNMQAQTARREALGGVVQQEPSVAVAAEKNIQKKFGVEAQAYSAMNYMSRMDALIKRLGE